MIIYIRWVGGVCMLFWLKFIVCEYQYPWNCGADFGATRSMKAEAIAIKSSVLGLYLE